MISDEAVASAIAFFEASDDVMLLHRLSSGIAPRARRDLARLIAKDGEDAVPGPARIEAASTPATRDEAIDTLRAIDDFAHLQALARAIGRRIEDIETVASAELGERTRVTVPVTVAYPPEEGSATATGVIERTGTWLRVRLDSGDAWEGPPSLAHRGGIA